MLMVHHVFHATDKLQKLLSLFVSFGIKRIFLRCLFPAIQCVSWIYSFDKLDSHAVSNVCPVRQPLSRTCLR